MTISTCDKMKCYQSANLKFENIIFHRKSGANLMIVFSFNLLTASSRGINFRGEASRFLSFRDDLKDFKNKHESQIPCRRTNRI